MILIQEIEYFAERNCYSNADQAVEFYNHYKEDIQRMKDINMDAFRFSISWPRILPRKFLTHMYNTIFLIKRILRGEFSNNPVETNPCFFLIFFPKIVGKKSKGVNQEGINFYNDLIDELLANGI